MGCSPMVSLVDESANSIEDVHRRKLNKIYIINKISTVEGDLKLLLNHPVYSAQADGTKCVDREDSTKIGLSKQQLDDFLKDFKILLGNRSDNFTEKLYNPLDE
jgi:hypothetical protein